MTSPKNPPDFDTDSFSPAPRYRETTIQEVIDNAVGFEPPAVPAYPFRNRTFVELEPYDDEDETP